MFKLSTRTMRPDKGWMLRRKDQFGSIIEEFRNCVDGFIQVAKRDPKFADVTGRIPCPCGKCRNRYWDISFNVEKHLYHHGFMDGYTNWTLHGEERWTNGASIVQDRVEGSTNPYHDMVMNAFHARSNLEVQEVEEDPNPSAKKFFNLLKSAENYCLL